LNAGLRGSAAAGGRRAVALIAIVTLGLVAACQSLGPSPRATVGATVVASGSPSPTASPSPSVENVAVDPTLLSILPRDVGGVLMLPAPDAATQIALDSSLVPEVEAIAVALAVGAGSSGTEDLVIANVVRLRPDVFDETFFEGWRTTYDEAACEPAGGVRGSSEDQIGGRQVFVGTCLNGGSTYHVRYGEDVIVSLTSTGERNFGKIVMEQLGG
jgi:hypothetical protein